MINKFFKALTVFLTLTLLTVNIHAATMPGISIGLSGTKLGGERAYGSQVTVQVTPDAPLRSGDRLLISLDRRWMVFGADPQGKYITRFAQDGEYTVRFCIEDASGSRGAIQSTTFRIDAKVAKLVEDCKLLPDPAIASMEEVEQARDQIMAVRKRYTDLSEPQLSMVPEPQREQQRMLNNWLANMRPEIDVRSPATPEVTLVGDRPEVAEVYMGAVTINVNPQTKNDVARVVVRENGQWSELKQDADGGYRIICNEPKAYSYDFAVEDEAGNRSALRSESFEIDPIPSDFMIRAQAAQGAETENLLVEYYGMETARRLKMSQETLDILWTRYQAELRARGMEAEVSLDGKNVRAVGMMRGFEGKGEQMALFAEDGAPKQLDITLPQKAVWEYTIEFLDKNDIVLDSQHPIKLLIEIPAALRGRKNVQIYDENGNSMGCKVKNEDVGLVLEFQITNSGRYFFAADA